MTHLLNTALKFISEHSIASGANIGKDACHPEQS